MASYAITNQRQLQIKNIAVLTDMGSETQTVLRFATSLAQWYGAKLMVAHACAPDSNTCCSPAQAASSFGKTRSKLPISVVAQAVATNVIKSSTLLELLEQMEFRQPDLLIVGTHGRTGLDKWFNGSIAEEVFRKVQWPVLVLPPGFANNELRSGQFQRVLLATDFSGSSAKSFPYAAGIAQDHEAHLVALHVDTDGTAYSFERLIAMQCLEDWIHRQALAYGSAPQPECIVRFGKASEEILQAACDYKSELIVMGARTIKAMSILASHFVDGTAYEVACSSPCPVLIVPNID